MKEIRRGTFETNSSSTHSVSIRKRPPEFKDYRTLYVHDDRWVHASVGEFGWEFEDYDDPETKLSYIITLICTLNKIVLWCAIKEDEKELFEERRVELSNCEDFQQLEKEIIEVTGCKGIYVEDGEGYIDHQSCEYYSKMSDFLDEWGLESYTQFIFDSDVVLHTGNDNV